MSQAAAKAHRLYIDGKWVDGKETLAVIDKYTGETIGQVPVASKEMTDRAIGAATRRSRRTPAFRPTSGSGSWRRRRSSWTGTRRRSRRSSAARRGGRSSRS